MNTNINEDIIYDCVIIGGGLSGISFAHYLHKAGKTSLTLEKNEKIGGQLETNFAKTDSKFWYELGAHTCYNSYTNLLSIAKDMDAIENIQPLAKSGYVLYKDNKIKSIFSGISILPLIFNFPKYFSSDKTGKTVREYFRPIAGAKNYDQLFSNAFKAVISQNADNYPAEIFLKKRKEKQEDLPRRFTFKNGLSSFLQIIVDRDKLDIHISSEVISIRKVKMEGNEIFQITTNNGNAAYAHNIALATDPKTTALLLNDIEKELSQIVSSIPIFESESVNVIIPKDKLNLKAIAGIIPISNDFLSVVSRDLVEDNKLRSFTFHFEKGVKNEKERLDLICMVLNISPSDIIEQASTKHVLPSMRLEHLGMDERIKQKKLDQNIYLLGNYFLGLSLEDCVSRSLEESKIFLEKTD